MVVNKTKLAVVLLVLGLVFGILVGYGVLSITQSQGKFLFDLMFLLTMIWMLISTIRKRHADKGSVEELI